MHNLSDQGNHTDTSVLRLNITTTFEGLGFGIEPSKRVIYSKRSSNSKVKFVHGKVGRCACNVGRNEGKAEPIRKEATASFILINRFKTNYKQ